MTTEIPPEYVPPIVNDIANTHTMWACVIWFIGGTGSLSIALAPGSQNDPLGGVVMFVLWTALFLWLGLRQLRFSKRASDVARRAEEAIQGGTHPRPGFVLDYRELLVYENADIPRPCVELKLSRRHIAMLPALPKAQLRR